MKTQHTPGPWKASKIGDYNDNGGDCLVVLGDDRRIAVVHVSRVDYEGEANASLIAAAPDLLTVAFQAAELLARIPAFGDTIGTEINKAKCGIVLRNLRAAIAKATAQ